MKDVSEILYYRSIFGRNVSVLIGTIASIYIATKGIQFISKKIADKKKHSTEKISTDKTNIESSSNTNLDVLATNAVAGSVSSDELHRKSSYSKLLDSCKVCQSPFSIAKSEQNEVEIDNIASCNRCLSQTCKSPRCTIWLPKHSHWECSDCHHFDCIVYARAYDWIFERLNRRFDFKTTAVDAINTPPIDDTSLKSQDLDVMLELNDESSPIPLHQRVRVREFIEDLLGSMLGGSLDNVCVGQIYKNLEYIKIFLLFHCELSNIIFKLEVSLHQALSSDLPVLEHDKSPGISYDNLRKIVHTIVQEVIKLPEFYNQSGFSSVDANQVQSSFEPKIYEDLLATAVINKIVETYNDKKYENSSGIHSGGSDLDSSCHIDQNSQNFILNSRCSSTELKSEYSGFGERFRSPSMKTAEIIDGIFREKLGKENCGSGSVHSELSDYIQNHKIALPDLDFDNNDIEDDDSDEIEQEFQSIYESSRRFDSNYSEISDNWLFRKVGSQNYTHGSTSSVVSASSPVGMLVPSPTHDCPTLIGNQIADEISDLSENGSDTESLHETNWINNLEDNIDDERLKLKQTLNPYDLPHVLVENKTLIGGKNEMNSFEQSKAALIDLLEPDSLVSEQSLTGQSPVISEAKNNLILIEDRSTKNFTTANKFSKMDPHTTNRETNNQYEIETSPDLLIKFDSLEAYNDDIQHEPESNYVEIVHKIDKNNLNAEFEPNQPNDTEDMRQYADKKHNSDIESDISPTRGAICSHQSLMQITEEYKDSLEFSPANKRSSHINGNHNESALFDSVEQDSLETSKIDSIVTDDGAHQFLPFAHIGTVWSNESATQNNTDQFNTNTNQNVETESTNRTNEIDDHTNNILSTEQSIGNDIQDPSGSIAETEHILQWNRMKWNYENAVELPNNPYSAEALKRRLSQSSSSKFIDIDRLTSNFEANNSENKPLGPSNEKDETNKIELGSSKVNPERYCRDYYINDSKSASGSRVLKSSGNLNLHRTFDDEDIVHDEDDNNPESDYDMGDSLIVDNIEAVSSEKSARLQSDTLTNHVKTLNVTKPIQVDENDPILSKAKKLDHLCTEDRDYFLLESDTVSAEEYAKLSLSSETTEDSHVQQISLPHCDDSLSTTISEESDCVATVRVYDLNRRETKILRHDLIKRSRNPVGDSIKSLQNLGNCCSETIPTTTSPTPAKVYQSNSPLHNTIEQIDSHFVENANETRKPPRSPTKLKSVHLNRNPRKLKMADVQLMNDAFGTSLDPKIVDEIKRKNEIKIESKIENGDKLGENEEAASSIAADVIEQHQVNDDDIKPQTVEINRMPEILVNESANDNELDDEDESPVQNIESNGDNCVNQNSEPSESILSTHESADAEIMANAVDAEDIQNANNLERVEHKNNEIDADEVKEVEEVINQLTSSIESDKKLGQMKIYERNYEVIVKVNEHKERSVIEEDVISALPSVKELARSFSTKRDERPQKIQRPKMVWRNSNNGSNNNDINIKDQNGNSGVPSPHFNHSYHPVAPGYSITARSLSTKFREELKNVTDDNNGRSSPERPSSPVLVPGILKNNVAFFENLRNK